MQATIPQSSNVLARDDTFLGVCEALGEDFGFNPIYLRIVLGAGLLWNPLAMIGAYLALGAIVLVSRLLVRNPASASTSAEAAADGKASAGEPARAPAEERRLPEAANAPLAETLAVAA